MKKTILAASLLLATPPALAGSRDTWNKASRVGEVALVATAMGFIVANRNDSQGFEQFALTGVTAAGVTYGLKTAIKEQRPDGSGDDSFPSGHTSISFASAGFIGHRYGWKYGLPAMVAATGVGIARVAAKKHHWYDVVAGAAIGEGSALLFVRSKDNDYVVMPWGDTKEAGITFAARF
jgi:membrane-associated phospholipid phosphatase